MSTAFGVRADGSPTTVIHESVIAETGRLLRQSKRGWRKHEAVVYWTGRDLGGECLVTTCIAPDAVTSPGSFHVSAEANAHAITLLNKLGLVLVGQVHSHPGNLIGHSGGDDRGAFMPFENLISIVVPNYGRLDPWPLTRCGVHRFVGGVFRKLTEGEVERKFRVLPAACDLRRT
jgi:proteasome lid subunit RPN8/RPN11